MLAVKSGFILFIKSYQFPLQINTLERERVREREIKITLALPGIIPVVPVIIPGSIIGLLFRSRFISSE